MATLPRRVPVITSLRVPLVESEVGVRIQLANTAPRETDCPLPEISNLRFSKILRLEIVQMNYDIKRSGERIRQLRIESGLTQEKTAAALNIDRSFYNRIETGKKGCSIDLFIQLSNLFHVSLDYLILGKYSGNSLDNTDRVQIKEDIAKLVAHLEQFRITL